MLYDESRENKMLNMIKEKMLFLYKDYKIYNTLKYHNYICAAEKAKKWIERYTIRGNGIAVTSRQRVIYQEVTGYYIPTLLQWGMREKAIGYARWLCDVQQESGAWLSFDLKHESVFNTGQVLRGLVEIYDTLPEVKKSLYRGCQWLLSNMQPDGRLASAKGTVWPENGMNSELIHLYCLPPLIEAGKKLNNPYYIQCVHKILSYYCKKYYEDIVNFKYLSHFYAYVLEALLDLGKKELVLSAMKKIERQQRADGMVPAYQNGDWVCSTGLFQLAIIWFKLGKWKQGNKAFDYAVSLQNRSGGWYGGYPATVHVGDGKRIDLIFRGEKIDYFPNEEISWAVKYFFDALFYREVLEFEKKAHLFLNQIKGEDGKYQAVLKQLRKQSEKIEIQKVLDVGCGKGRYLRKLFMQFPQHEYYGVDLSEKVLSYVKNKQLILKKSSILKIDYEDDKFDMVYAAESLEHAILIEEAVREMVRVLNPGGRLVIIDKDAECFERVKYSSWIFPEELATKQWLEKEKILMIMKKAGLEDTDSSFIPTEEGTLYRVFVGRKAENRIYE